MRSSKTKTKNVSLLKISILVQIVVEILPQLCSNASLQILLKMAWFDVNVRNQANLKRISMGSSCYNCGNISSLMGCKMLNFVINAFSILFLLNITTVVIAMTICTNMLIFSKDTFLVLISHRISTNPISQGFKCPYISYFSYIFSIFL